MREFFHLVSNKRFRQIFSLFIVFVFQFWWLGKKKRFLSSDEIEHQYRRLYEKQASKFTDTATTLGGLLIKLGQFFSSRVDILPKEYTDELSKLQDGVQPVDTNVIRERVTEELGKSVDKIFTVFASTPLAAASLGQVHWARLPGGEEVVVKVLRPGIEEIVAVDLEALKVIIAFARRYPRIRNLMDLDQVYREFRETVSDELDYVKEAHNLEKFKGMFSDDERIYIPRVYRNYSAQKVLTMEFIRGVKVNDLAALDREGIDRAQIADTLLSGYLRQVLVEGFFHADPHPGNILVRSDGTLVLLDFGMVGRVDENMKNNMINLAVSLFKRDAGAVVDAFYSLGFLKPHADRNTMIKSVRLMLVNLFNDSAEMGKLDFTELSMELRELMYSQPFQLPAQTTFLGKALITVFGLCNGLDDKFDLMHTVNPYIEEVFKPGTEISAGSAILDQAKKTLFDVIGMPEKVNRFIEGIETGEIRMHPSRSFEQRLFEYQESLANKIVFAVLSVGFLIAGSQLLSIFYELGIALFAISGGLALMSIRRGSARRPRMRGMRNMGTGFKKPKFHP